MADFWGYGKGKRLSNEVRTINSRISRKINKLKVSDDPLATQKIEALERMRQNVSQIKEQVGTDKSNWRRARNRLKKLAHASDSLDFTEVFGEVVTKAEKREVQTELATKKRRQKQAEKDDKTKLFPEDVAWNEDEATFLEAADHYENADVQFIEPEKPSTYEEWADQGVMAKVYNYTSSLDWYYQQYLNEWMGDKGRWITPANTPFSDDLVRAINYLYKFHPRILLKAFRSGNAAAAYGFIIYIEKEGLDNWKSRLRQALAYWVGLAYYASGKKTFVVEAEKAKVIPSRWDLTEEEIHFGRSSQE